MYGSRECAGGKLGAPSELSSAIPGIALVPCPAPMWGEPEPLPPAAPSRPDGPGAAAVADEDAAAE
eukprot:scaffold175381_cov18-Tisochrysis_lutea.AAC.1